MLGYVTATGQGEADRLLAGVAERLQAQGLRLAGAVQVNLDAGEGRKCFMDLHILSGDDVVRISQDLGALAQGCRLDPEGLERAVGLAEAALTPQTDLVIINKFGKQELFGRGFRPLIGEALSRGVPVLLAVDAGNLEGFIAFSEGLGASVAPDPEAVLGWVAQTLGETA